jgi:UDP-N-acetylmuramoyl-L-alanyl-D-glutamate--2,6-diaminopimelate ligase
MILDRAQAIERAIQLAQPGDCVLLAGKGHEDYQIIGDQRSHFDDREVAREALARRRGEKVRS